MSKLTLGQILLQKGFVKPDDLKQARNVQIQNPSKSLAEENGNTIAARNSAMP